MLQMRSRTMVLAGVTVALVGALAVFVYGRSVAARSGGEDGVSAFVAAKDIPAGTVWNAASPAIDRRSVPASLRPAGAITSPEQVAGRTSVRQISKGEVITNAQFGRSTAAPAAGLEIPPKHNAVTINLSPPQGVGHYAQPGDVVNIYTTIKNTAGDGPITKLMLSNVQVLANRSATAEEGKGVAGSGEVLLTLALRPGQAEKVIFAKENGSLWFGLVHPGDKPVTTGAGRTAANVLH